MVIGTRKLNSPVDMAGASVTADHSAGGARFVAVYNLMPVSVLIIDTLMSGLTGRLTNMADALGTTNCSYAAGNQLLTGDGPFARDTVTNTYSNRRPAALGLQKPTGDRTNGSDYPAVSPLG